MVNIGDIEKLINPECPGCQALLKLVLELQQEIIKLKQWVSDLEAMLSKNSLPLCMISTFLSTIVCRRRTYG